MVACVGRWRRTKSTGLQLSEDASYLLSRAFLPIMDLKRHAKLLYPCQEGIFNFSLKQKNRRHQTPCRRTRFVCAPRHKWPTELPSRLLLLWPLCLSLLIPLLAPPTPLPSSVSALKNGESVLKLSQVSMETASQSTMYLCPLESFSDFQNANLHL